MGRMTEDMTRLSDEIIAKRGMRMDFLADLKEAVADLRAATEEMQAGFREAHGDMAADMKAELEASVANLKNTVTATLDGFLEARTSMSAQAKAQLGAFCAELRREAADLQRETNAMRGAIRDAQAQAARGSREERWAFLEERLAFLNQFMDQVAHMLAGIKQAQEETAAAGRRSREEFVSELKAKVAGQQAGFNEDRRRRAQETKAQLQDFGEGIKAQVGEFKSTVAAWLQEFAEDMAGARTAWQGKKASAQVFKPAPQQGRPEPGPKGKEPLPEEEPEAAEPAGIYLDQLTAIKGIGARIQSKLYLAGIGTYAELAQSDPQYLREILGSMARAANVDSWIEQAKDLA